jgi:hypothetical protein
MRIARQLWVATVAATVAAPGTLSCVAAAERQTVETLRHIGPALFACWRSPDEVGDFEVRVRLSFRKDGSVIGRPRIVFSRFAGGPAEQRRIVRAVVDALAKCTPVPFSPSLGSAVAGRIFTIGFTPPSRRAEVAPRRGHVVLHLAAGDQLVELPGAGQLRDTLVTTAPESVGRKNRRGLEVDRTASLSRVGIGDTGAKQNPDAPRVRAQLSVSGAEESKVPAVLAA